MRLNSGVDAIVLHHAGRSGDAVQHEGQKGAAGIPRHDGEAFAELPGVAAAIVGRDFHAQEHGARARRLRLAGHRGEVAAQAPDRVAAQAVVAAEFDDDDGRPMPRQKLRQARRAAAGRLAADAGIHHPVAQPLRREPRFQQSRPTRGEGHAVGGGDAVAHDEDGFGFGVGVSALRLGGGGINRSKKEATQGDA